jgi:catechol 2,3-dioxygenase-like lactoylglutathione lyase family enzyme
MDQHHGAAMEAIQPRGVVHFSIAVSDLEASRKFYTEVLGLKQIFHAPEFKMVFLMAGKDYVILCKSETPIHPNPQGQRRVHHAFAVDPASYDSAKMALRSSTRKTARPASSPAGRCISTILIGTCSNLRNGRARNTEASARSKSKPESSSLAQHARRTVGTGRRSH